MSEFTPSADPSEAESFEVFRDETDAVGPESFRRDDDQDTVAPTNDRDPMPPPPAKGL